MKTKNKMLRFILFCIFFSPISCSLIGPDYKRPEINLPNAYHNEVGKENVVSDLNMWWKLYQDPALNEIMDKALVKNTDINAAIARVEESDAYLKEIDAALLPEVNLTSQASRTKSTTTGATTYGKPIKKDYLIRLGTSFELDFWGKLRNQSSAGAARAEAQQADYQNALLGLQSELAMNYFALRVQDAQIALLRRTVALRRKT
ncbi:MAG: hypothetical protein RIR83_1810, partial [Pseudomonadota bacterium]